LIAFQNAGSGPLAYEPQESKISDSVRQHPQQPLVVKSARGRTRGHLGGHIAVHPDITLAALQSGRTAEHAVRLSKVAMWSAVNRLRLSLIPTWDNIRHPFIS
jgi:hypothetical protein